MCKRTRTDMENRRFIEQSYEFVAPFGYEPEMCKRQRKGKYFTDDDLSATKKLLDDTPRAYRMDAHPTQTEWSHLK
jgi:hypothetical protein